MLKSSHLITPPTASALEIGEVKLFLKIDHDSEDTLLTRLIHTATNQFERYTGQFLIKQLWKSSFEQMPSRKIKLPAYPVMSLEKVTTSSFANKEIQFDLQNAELEKKSGTVIFKAAPLCRELSIYYWVGFGESSQDIPVEIGSLLISHVAHLYEHRATGDAFPLSVYQPFKVFRL